jgi:hypothetical protein
MKSRSKPGAVIDLGAAKKAQERKRYASLVLKAFDDMDHAGKRDFLERKTEVERKARKAP